jgi:hypothetical protein
MAEEIKNAPWEVDFEDFANALIDAKNNLSKGFWCVDHDVKYLTVRIDTRDMGYMVFADGRGPIENASNKFRISPDAVRAAINTWRDKYHDKPKALAPPLELSGSIGNTNPFEHSIVAAMVANAKNKAAEAAAAAAEDVYAPTHHIAVVGEISDENAEYILVPDADWQWIRDEAEFGELYNEKEEGVPLYERFDTLAGLFAKATSQNFVIGEDKFFVAY